MFKQSPLFKQSGTRRVIHHRALNSPAQMDAALALAARLPGVRQAYESDICWDFEGGNRLLYCRHPHFVFDALKPGDIAAQAKAGKLFLLEDALARLPNDAEIICELKVGRGDATAALTALVAVLDAKAQGRWWIDTFSPTLLRRVREIAPHAPLSLHTERAGAKGVWVCSPQDSLRRVRYADLSWIDAISLRWWGAWPRMATSLEQIRAHGFTPLLSRLIDDDRIARWAETSAWGGYVEANASDATVRAIAAAAATPIHHAGA